jgi:hypothetical protein
MDRQRYIQTSVMVPKTYRFPLEQMISHNLQYNLFFWIEHKKILFKLNTVILMSDYRRAIPKQNNTFAMRQTANYQRTYL